MAKAKREKTRYPNVYKVGNRYEWISKRSNTRGMADALQDAYEAKLRADASGQVVTAEARGPFGAYAREWVANYQGRTARGFSEGTRRRYRESLELWAVPFFDAKRRRKFAAVEKPDVRAFVAWLANPDRTDAAGDPYGPSLTVATIRNTLAPVRAMYEDAIEDGTLTKANPASVRVNVQRDDVDDAGGARRAFTPEELAAVLDAAGNDADRLLFDTLAETGARWGEACEWRGRDLKTTPAGPRLCVHRAYSDKTKGKTGAGVVKLPKSSYGRREIPITPELARRLWRLQRGRDELLFTAPQGGRMVYTHTRRRVLLPMLKTAGVEWRAGFHTFRHTRASELFAAGRNVKQVQRWLGHHKPSFTLDTYVHFFGDDMGTALAVGDTGGTRGAPEATENGLNDGAAREA